MMKNPCSICGKPYSEYGNEAWPVKPGMECCDECDRLVVLPERIKLTDAAKIKDGNARP